MFRGRQNQEDNAKQTAGGEAARSQQGYHRKVPKEPVQSGNQGYPTTVSTETQTTGEISHCELFVAKYGGEH